MSETLGIIGVLIFATFAAFLGIIGVIHAVESYTLHNWTSAVKGSVFIALSFLLFLTASWMWKKTIG